MGYDVWKSDCASGDSGSMHARGVYGQLYMRAYARVRLLQALLVSRLGVMDGRGGGCAVCGSE